MDILAFGSIIFGVILIAVIVWSIVFPEHPSGSDGG